ncbi:FecCD family ABC transporter permease [Thiobacillus sedimenti]|uniref:Iron ABC transporter permease n=1 Tax=Thiobacillus sedimenti TaxID=3110231 RepID=A0ABZ1CHM0_9PROT|nr:iron ABC transporter permease [Thiobacillus sp. SCUT-2]WRS38570.1 iron ABC transporter permease [Thiobacillus sp. SCUT-2]
MAGALPADRALALEILTELRGPRVGVAFACGGLLALAGALMQTLFRNPLAEPYLLGVSGGAGLLALFGMAAGLAWPWIPVLALAGSLLALGLAAALGGRLLARDHTPLLLAGVMLAAGFGALIALVLAIAPAERLPGMLYFLMGDLAWSGNAALPLAALLVAVAAALAVARRLDVLQLSPLKAASLGVPVAPTRWMLFGLAGACTALVVAQAGSIGFVGLMVPHALRRLGFAGHRVLLPAAALAGGSLLVLADALARTVMAPRELPVGVLTALLGVPVMLWLLRRR